MVVGRSSLRSICFLISFLYDCLKSDKCQFIVFKRHHIMQNIVFYYFDNMYNIVFKKKMLIFAPLEKD